MTSLFQIHLSERTSVGGLRVVTLTTLVKIAFPPLYITSLPKNAIGFSFERGKFGVLIGSSLLATSVLLSILLSRAIGILSLPLAMWLLGDTSLLMLYNSTSRSIAFVKPLCAGCRLRPIIEEHEGMHLAGMSRDRQVWSEMKKRHSYESLSLEGDSSICSFCPIPKRLKEH